MKGKFLFLLFVLFLASCSKGTKYLKNTKIEFEAPHRRYNPILEGAVLTVSYKFKNTGKYPLIISEVQTSCGCVLVEYTEKTIGKGEVGYINLKFDSSKNLGYVKQYINVLANVENALSKNISFELNVIPNSQHIKDYEEIFFSDKDIKDFSKNYIPIEG